MARRSPTFTYFQQAGGINLSPISAEITYGLERIAMYLQDKADVFDVEWAKGVPNRRVRHEEEFELSRYSFELADVDLHMMLFEGPLGEAKRLLDTGGPRVALAAAGANPADTGAVEKTAHGVIVRTTESAAADVKVEAVAPGILRVMADPDGDFARTPSLMRAETGAPPAVKVGESGGQVTISTQGISATVDARTGQVSFFDAAGKPLLAERARTFTPTTVEGKPYYSIRQRLGKQEAKTQNKLSEPFFELDRLLALAASNLEQSPLPSHRWTSSATSSPAGAAHSVLLAQQSLVAIYFANRLQVYNLASSSRLFEFVFESPGGSTKVCAQN